MYGLYNTGRLGRLAVWSGSRGEELASHNADSRRGDKMWRIAASCTLTNSGNRVGNASALNVAARVTEQACVRPMAVATCRHILPAGGGFVKVASPCSGAAGPVREVVGPSRIFCLAVLARVS